MKRLLVALILFLPLLLAADLPRSAWIGAFPATSSSSFLSGAPWNGINYTLQSRFFWCALMRSSGATTLVDDCTADSVSNNLTTKVGTPVTQQTEVPTGSHPDARSAVFDGVSDLWKVADGETGPFDASVLAGGDGFSFGCYGRSGLGAGAGWFFSKDGAAINMGLIQVSSTGHRFYAGPVSVTNNESATDDVWYHHMGHWVSSAGTSESIKDQIGMTPVVRSAGTAEDAFFGVGANIAETQEWFGHITECWISNELVSAQDSCRICRCGLLGDFAGDRKTNCNNCTMSTDSCATGG